MHKKFLVLAICGGAIAPAWAQRGGSVRYSGGGGFSTASGTPVRYQAPMNTGGGLYQNRYQNAASYQSNRYINGGGAVATPTPVRYQAPVNLPVGTAVRSLPVGYRAMALYGTNYYYYDGTYYADDNGAAPQNSDAPTQDYPSQPAGSYKVVPPPVGAQVDILPVGAQEISPGVYQANGVKYRPCFDDGKVVYIVSN